MVNQTILVIVLVGLILTLTFLLIKRIRSERRLMAVIRGIDLEQFADFVSLNASDGSIQLIARRVSDFLKNSFGCERIIFMRKQRAHLELNYYHGIRAFRRDEFRFRYSRALSDNLRSGPLPRAISELASSIPASVSERLNHHQFNQFFSIYWRDNLYGIYFIRSTLATDTSSFRLLIVSLAQALAAAYHIKWHEARYERIEKRRDHSAKSRTDMASESHIGLIKLIKHRQADSLIPQIGQMLGEELSLGGLALLYEPTDRNAAIQVWQSDQQETVSPPGREEFLELFSRVPEKNYLNLTRSDNTPNANQSDSHSLLSGSGFRFAARFPISARRRGLIAWTACDNPVATVNQLENIGRVTSYLVENVDEYEKVEARSNTDSLTGLANQRYFEKRLNEEINRAIRYNRYLSLIIFDLDNLKGINDQYGHLAGNEVLKRMGQILRSSIRAIDVIARYGGDEFCVIMPEADGVMCQRFMKRLRAKISGSKFIIDDAKTELRCTISQGGAVLPENGRGDKTLMLAADTALLQAKEMGRDRFILNSSHEQTPSS